MGRQSENGGKRGMAWQEDSGKRRWQKAPEALKAGPKTGRKLAKEVRDERLNNYTPSTKITIR
jgi:hypothetical protein